MDYFRQNIDALKSRYNQLHEKIATVIVDENIYETISTKNGSLSLKAAYTDGLQKKEIYLHSKYDPQSEALAFVKANFGNRAETNVLYGFGLGYHIQAMLDVMGENDKLYVLEINLQVFKVALKVCCLERIFQDSRVELMVTDNEEEMASFLKKVLVEGTNLVVHMPSVKLIPEGSERFRFILENYDMHRDAHEVQGDIIRENISNNRLFNCPNVGSLFNEFRDKPVIIVSSGPSLDKNKQFLKEAKGKALIIAAGSALKTLLAAGIEPDMFCISDPHDVTYEQIKGLENLNIPFVFLDATNYRTVSSYKGPKLRAVNEVRESGDEKFLVESGGSVATVIMDMAVKFGGNPIVFVGQDLAYSEERCHAGCAEEENKLKILLNMRQIQAQNGNILYTSLTFLSYKHWIENTIKAFPGVRFINATEGGVRIEGCHHMELKDFINSYLGEGEASVSGSIKFPVLVKGEAGDNLLLMKYKDKPLVLDGTNVGNKRVFDINELKKHDANTVFVLFGLGLGNSLIELSSFLRDSNQVIVIEPSRAVVSYAMFANRIETIIKKTNARVVCGRDIVAVRNVFEQHIKIEAWENVKLVVHENYDEIYKDYLQEVRDALEFKLRQLDMHVQTMKVLGAGYNENIFKNLPYIVKSNDISCLKNKFSGKPGIIVSAGPSLEKNIHLLKDIQDNALIVAGGRTLKPLLECGITPHIVCSVDADNTAYEIIKDSLPTDIPLLTLTHSNNDVISRYGKNEVFINDINLKPVIDNICGRKMDVIETGGSVATVSLSFLQYAGCDPIIFVGQDLAYSDQSKHSSLTCSDKEANRIGKIGKSSIFIEDIFGKKIPTSTSLFYFLKWIEGFIKKYEKITFIQASEGGAKIEGAANMTLHDVIEKYCSEKCGPQSILHENIQKQHEEIAGVSDVRFRLEGLYANLEKCRQLATRNSELSSKLYEFYGGDTTVNIDNLLKEMDEVDDILNRYLLEENLVYYSMQPHSLEISRKYSEKLIETELEGCMRISEMNVEIYKAKALCFEENLKYVKEAIEKMKIYNEERST